MLCSMGGFTERQAKAALQSCNLQLERAADWLFSRMDNLDAAVAEAEGDTTAVQVRPRVRSLPFLLPPFL